MEFRTLGNRRGIAECLAGLAGLAAGEDARWAARLLGAAHALMAKSGGAWWPADQVEVQRALEKIRSSLDESQFTKSWQAGQAMGLDEAIRFALAAPKLSFLEETVSQL